MIHAWLDGELGAVEAARVERLVAEDAAWAAAAAEARGLIAASSRILSALDVVAGDVIPRGGSAARVEAQPFDGSRASAPRVTRRLVPTWMRIAAGFVLVAGVAYLGRDQMDTETTPSEMRENAAKVVGDLASTVRAEAASDAVAPPVASAGSSAVSRTDSSAIPSVAPKVATGVVIRLTPGAMPTSERSAEQGAAQAPATPSSSISPNAPASPSASAPAEPAKTAASGVAGGVAFALVPRPDSEPAAMRGAVAGARMARALESVTVTGVVSADRSAEEAGRRTITTGCWRAQTSARVDSIPTTLRVVRTEGDTLVVALMPTGAEARVVWESDTVLRGTARGNTGLPVAFRAERVRCAP